MKVTFFPKCRTFSLLLLTSLLLAITTASAYDTDRSNWYPFKMMWNDTAHTITDLSNPAEMPAGKHGFLNVGMDGHFHFPGNTAPVRFHGVVITAGAIMPTKDQAPLVAARLAKLGVNFVRLHLLDLQGEYGILVWDAKNKVVLNPDNVDRMDYFFKCLKDRGIYILMPMWGGRSFAPDGRVPANAGFGHEHHCALIFDTTLIRFQKEYAKAIFEHVNPYTTMAYKDDPFVAMTELMNETALFNGWLAWAFNAVFSVKDVPNGLNPYYAAELDTLFNNFLKSKYTNNTNLANAWVAGGWEPGVAGIDTGESLDNYSVKRTMKKNNQKYSDARIADNAEFYYKVETDYIKTMKAYLKDSLGVKTPVTFTNQYFGMPSMASQAAADFMDTHRYWDYPNGNPKKFHIHNDPMVKAPSVSILQYITMSHVENKPLVVSEYNHPFPNSYQIEAPAFMYGYLGFLGADAVVWHCYKDFDPDYTRALSYPFYEMAVNPPVLTQMLLSKSFLLGYLKSPPPTVVEYTDSDLWRTAKRTADSIRIPTPWVSPGASALPNPVVQRFHSDKTGPKQLPDPGYTFQNSTKEILWDSHNGFLAIDNPRWQGAVGFLPTGTKLSQMVIGNVTTSNGRTFAAIHQISLDSLPLETSKKRVLLVSGRFENINAVWNDSGTFLDSLGHDTTICEPVKVEVGIYSKTPDSLKVFALDEAGNRVMSMAVRKGKDTAWVMLDAKTLWYQIAQASENLTVSVGSHLEGNALVDLHLVNATAGFGIKMGAMAINKGWKMHVEVRDIKGGLIREWTREGNGKAQGELVRFEMPSKTGGSIAFVRATLQSDNGTWLGQLRSVWKSH